MSDERDAHTAEWDPATWLIAAGRSHQPGQPLNVPPSMASNFYLPSERVYSRCEGTETANIFEEIVGGLEGGQALAFSSGMAAVAVVFHRFGPGSVLVLPDDPYHAVSGLAEEGQKQGRWTVIRLDIADTEAWTDAAQTADLLWLESPANPLITVADLPAICAAPRKPGTIVAVDSTFATPLLQQPLSYGADVVMHSATKFIGGHSDLLAGVLVTDDDALYDEFYQRRLINGGTIGAMEAFLATRGIRSMELRLERSQSNALELAKRLEAHPEIARVRYPGLESHDTHEVAKSFMSGFGAMLSFETTGSGSRASAVCAATNVVNHATSLGSIESTMERRAAIEGQQGMPPTLIRFSVGCESLEDLWRDLAHALEATKGL